MANKPNYGRAGQISLDLMQVTGFIPSNRISVFPVQTEIYGNTYLAFFRADDAGML